MVEYAIFSSVLDTIMKYDGCLKGHAKEVIYGSKNETVTPYTLVSEAHALLFQAQSTGISPVLNTEADGRVLYLSRLLAGTGRKENEFPGVLEILNPGLSDIIIGAFKKEGDFYRGLESLSSLKVHVVSKTGGRTLDLNTAINRYVMNLADDLNYLHLQLSEAHQSRDFEGLNEYGGKIAEAVKRENEEELTCALETTVREKEKELEYFVNGLHMIAVTVHKSRT